MASAEKHQRQDRIEEYIRTAERIQSGDFSGEAPITPPDRLSQLGVALNTLSSKLDKSYQELHQLDLLTVQIESGFLLDDVLERIFIDFRLLIPYNRMGVSLVEDDGSTVRAIWARTDLGPMEIQKGYSAPLKGSSLEQIMNTGEPRILNDLEQYLEQNPGSESTTRILQEGIRSSLTCPLKISGVPVGFLFFSSAEPDTYANVHAGVFRRIANRISAIVEKARLVSELAQREAELERVNEALALASAMMNRNLGRAAHDLRSPLHFVRGVLELLAEGLLDGVQAKNRIREAMAQCDVMEGMLGEVLAGSSAERATVDAAMKEVDLVDVVSGVVHRMRLVASHKYLTLDFETDEVIVVEGHPEWLRRAVNNLISNAIKFSPRGATITIKVAPDEDSWRVTVRDEGPGLTEAEIGEVFRPYTRGAAMPTGGEGQTGLGLSIVKHVADLHGGNVGVSSTVGNGAEFWLRLPGKSEA